MWAVMVYGEAGIYQLHRESFESACATKELMQRRVAFSSKRIEVIEL